MLSLKEHVSYFPLGLLYTLFPEGYFVPFSLRVLVSPFPFS